MTLHIATPLIPSDLLSARLGVRISLKLENVQPSGSFKLRGIGALVEAFAASGADGVVSSSGGNAGLAAAWAARRCGLFAHVVVPHSTPARIQARLAALGAEVEVHGAVWDEADARARALATSFDAGYVPPFDHPTVWAGNSTLVDELVDALDAPPTRIVVSVGGGGLLIGLVHGLRRVGWADVAVTGVETDGAASLAAALAAGAPVSIPITSIAKSLGASRVADEAFAVAQHHPVEVVRVSDDDAVAACRQLLADHHFLVEPACGAALAGLRACPLAPEEHVVVVVCGGSVARLQDLLE